MPNGAIEENENALTLRDFAAKYIYKSLYDQMARRATEAVICG